MEYEVEESVVEILTLARHDLVNFIAKHEDSLSASDIEFLQTQVLNRLNEVHQHLNLFQEKLR